MLLVQNFKWKKQVSVIEEVKGIVDNGEEDTKEKEKDKEIKDHESKSSI